MAAQPESPAAPQALLVSTLARFLPMAALVVASAVFYLQVEEHENLRSQRSTEQLAVSAGNSSATHALEHTGFDLAFIARNFERSHLCTHTATDSLAQFSQDLLSFSLSHPVYDQVRWIDRLGMERLRINSNGGHPAIVPAGQLQDKKNRYYFSDAVDLPRHMIYVSPLDLNIEHDKIERPYKPMIRLAMPVTDRRGNKCGVIVLNMFGAPLLDDFSKETSLLDKRVMLLNQGGFYLHSPQPEDEWGFMFGRQDLTLAHHHPAAWQRIANSEHGQFIDADGLWTFATAHPVDAIQAAETDSRATQSYYWKIVAFRPAEVLFARTNMLRRNTWLAAGSLLALLLVLSWRLALTNLERKRLKRELAARAAEYKDLYDYAPCAYHSIDADGRYVRINNTELDWIGRTHEEVIGKKGCVDFLTEDSQKLLKRGFAELLENDKVEGLELEVVCADGSIKPVSTSAVAVRDAQGNFLMSRSVMTDITAQKQMERLIEDRLLELRTILDNSSVAITFVKDRKQHWANQRMEELFGYTSAEMADQPTRMFFRSQEDYEVFGRRAYPVLLHGNTYHEEIEMRHRDGHSIWMNISGKAVSPADPALGSIWVLEDISERKELERKLEVQAHSDALTGLNNRGYFYDLAEYELARAKRMHTPLSLLLLDIDHFKQFNDSHGHDAGDAVLKSLAASSRKCLREIDIIARWGGEEFVVMLPGIDLPRAAEAAERLRLALAANEIELPSGSRISYTVSIGVACRTSDSENIDALVKRADNALYAAKHAGRNCIRTDDSTS